MEGDGLFLGASYQVKVESRNKAGLVAIARATLIVADWTPPRASGPTNMLMPHSVCAFNCG